MPSFKLHVVPKTQVPDSKDQQLGSGVGRELEKIQGFVDTLATKTAQLQELFLKTQQLHDQLQARLDRLESVRQNANVQRQTVQKDCSSQQTSCQFGQCVQTPQRQCRDISAVHHGLNTNWTTNYTKTDLAREEKHDKDLTLLYHSPWAR